MSLDPTLVAEPSIPSEPTIIRQFLEFRISDIHTASIGQVLTFNPVENTCNVQPLLKRIFVESDGTETVESAPILVNVPIKYARGGGFRFVFPLKPDDIVLLLFIERSIDEWSQKGGEVEPSPPRKHDWNDAVAIPGIADVLHAIAGVNLTDLIIGLEDGTCEIRVNESGITVKGVKIDLGDAGGAAVGRVGDQISIDTQDPGNTAFFAWIQAVSAAGPGVVLPFTGTIVGRIITGSPKVSAT